MTKNTTLNRELVVIPREEYVSLLRIKRRGIAEIGLSAEQRKAVAQSEKELVRGDYFTLDELRKYLAHSRTKARR